MHEIGTWFLLVSLVLPRTVLFFWWIFGNLPYNETPLAADVACAIFLPRILIMVYIYDLQGFGPWFWIHFGTMVLVWTANLIRFNKQQNSVKGRNFQ
jgi:hypothetical protein